MKSANFLSAMIIAFWFAADSFAQIPALPGGAQTNWIVDEPEEIVARVLFDPATVRDQLPSDLRFITLGEIADEGVNWAVDYLSENPEKDDWGISFLEFFRSETFQIDGVSPDWPENGAAVLWFARVTTQEPDAETGPGTPLLALEFWMPDRTYVQMMREKGHYATFGEAKLHQNDQNYWIGNLRVEDLNVYARCRPSGVVKRELITAGIQVIYPPQSSGFDDIVRVAYEGHNTRNCEEPSSLAIIGTHPLSLGVILEPVEFQFGYDLIGGSYNRSAEE